MNFNIYIDNNLAGRLEPILQEEGLSRSSVVREALELWLKHRGSHDWDPTTFEFKPAKDFPNASELRTDLQKSSDDLLSGL